jgi:hypothetical protein
MCGRCVQRRCQKEVDACCGDGACGGLLAEVESCAAMNDAHCTSVQMAATSSEGARRDLAACVAARCRGACETALPSSSTSCVETTFGVGHACTCKPESDAPKNSYRCDPTTFPETRCCSSPGWPSPGNSCTCYAVSCGTFGDGCMCFLADAYDPSGTTRCTGPICCRTDHNCVCGSRSCEADAIRVASCSVDTTPCEPGSVPRPEGCSLP